MPKTSIQLLWCSLLNLLLIRQTKQFVLIVLERLLFKTITTFSLLPPKLAFH